MRTSVNVFPGIMFLYNGSMRRTLKIIGIVLLVIAAVCYIVSSFYHWMAISTLDASARYYARLSRLRHVFIYLGVAFSLTGMIALILRMIIKNK